MVSGRWVSPARNQNLPPSSDCVTDCKNSLRYPRGADGLSVTTAAKGNVYVLSPITYIACYLGKRACWHSQRLAQQTPAKP